MPTFTNIIEIRDTPWNRAVKVTVIAPDDVYVLNVQRRALKNVAHPSD